MSATATGDALLTVPQAARALGAPVWKVRRLVDQLLPGVRRIALVRLVPTSLLPQLRDALAGHKGD
jgi:hypothetical protein